MADTTNTTTNTTVTKIPTLSKTLAQIRSELYENLDSVQEEYVALGYLPTRLNLNKGVARGIIEIFAFGLWQLYQYLDSIMQEAVPKSASATWLDVHAYQVGCTRKAAEKAYGNVAFYRADLDTLDTNIVISSGKIVKTLADASGEIYRYVTTQNGVILSGQEYCLIPVESESYGTGANAVTGQICELASPIEGVGSITNFSDWLTSEASDEETDTQLQKRYALAFSSQAGMTRAAYEAAALSVSGVEDVYISDQHPRGEGTLDIIVQGSAGTPTQNLLSSVEDAVAELIVINDDVLVKAPTAVSVDLEFTIELLSGSETEIKATALDYISKLFSCDQSVPYFGIGKDVILSRIEYGFINTTGVKRVVWASPTSDVTISKEEMASLGDVSISVTWVSDE